MSIHLFTKQVGEIQIHVRCRIEKVTRKKNSHIRVKAFRSAKERKKTQALLKIC